MTVAAITCPRLPDFSKCPRGIVISRHEAARIGYPGNRIR